MKTLICGIGKLENHYIREWVEWYKNIGVTNICLYDNNDVDGEGFEDVIGDYINSGFVILKDWRGLSCVQIPSYQSCYDEYKNIYDWIGFFDIDEFLEIEKGDINDFLTMPIFEDAGAIRVCWKNYNDNNILYTNNDFSIKRFTTTVAAEHICNRTSKVLIKGQQNIRFYPKPGGEHGIGISCIVKDCLGNIHDNRSFVLKERVWKNAWLRHYRFKTIEEYCKLKLKRLYPHVTPDVAKKYLKKGDFFDYNQWTPAKDALFNHIMSDNYTMKTLICCTGKNENRYIREYIDWYKSIGVTNICLYDNNDVDGERFEDVIRADIENGYVFYNDWRGRKLCQMQAYQDCYNKFGNLYDWILFIDCGDEYLRFNPNTGIKSISDFLSLPQFEKTQVIHLNLMTYGDSDVVEYENRPLSERFPNPIPYDKPIAYKFPENNHVSSIVRGYQGDEIKWNMTPHTPNNPSLVCCNEHGANVIANSPFQNYSFDIAWFAHYTSKTAREYAWKMKRGFPDHNCDGDRIKDLVETRFFRTNEITQEKIDIFKEELGLDFSYLLKRKDMDKRKDVQIFNLCYSKKDYAFKEDSVITPLQVGAANRTDVCELKDNTGDNISGGNFFYIENTGVYWIWKNINDAKYKGQMQYRRLLHGIDENTDFEEIFKDHDVITCVPYHYPDHDTPQKDPKGYIPAKTVEKGYAFSNCFMDLSILESIIKTNFPEYREDYDKYIKKGEDLYYSTGFILKSEDYDRYAQFLFNCLGLWLGKTGIQTPQDLYFHVGRDFGAGFYSQKFPNPYDVSKEAVRWETSIGGFLGERIWTLWLLHNFKPERIYKVEYDKQEENQWI